MTSPSENSIINLDETEGFDHDGLRMKVGQKNTILHLAARTGKKEDVENILRSHPELLQVTNLKGETPLHIAARLGYHEIADLLISQANKRHSDSSNVEVGNKKKPLQIANRQRNTALHEAVRNGHLAIVKSLIAGDPNLTCLVNYDGESPLFLAVDRMFYDIALYIVDSSQNCSYEGRKGMNVMHIAAIRIQRSSCSQGLDLVRKIMTNNRPNTSDEISTRQRNLCYEIDGLGNIPLHYAAESGNEKIVEMIVRKNKSLAFQKGEKGMSALHMSTMSGHVNVIKTLLKECPLVCELLDDIYRTALHVAVKYRKRDAVKVLLEDGIGFDDLTNERDLEGNTPFLLAALDEDPDEEILFLLANHNRVDKGARTMDGITAIDVIKSNNKLNSEKKVGIISMLEKEGVLWTRLQISELKSQEEQNKREITSKQKNEILSTGLIVATIIATISYASAMQIPGGFNSQGIPVLKDKPYFRLFLIHNSLAFGFSSASMLFNVVSGLVSVNPKRLLFICLTLNLFSIIFSVWSYGAAIDGVLYPNKNVVWFDSFKHKLDFSEVLNSIVTCTFLFSLLFFIYVYGKELGVQALARRRRTRYRVHSRAPISFLFSV